MVDLKKESDLGDADADREQDCDKRWLKRWEISPRNSGAVVKEYHSDAELMRRTTVQQHL